MAKAKKSAKEGKRQVTMWLPTDLLARLDRFRNSQRFIPGLAETFEVALKEFLEREEKAK